MSQQIVIIVRESSQELTREQIRNILMYRKITGLFSNPDINEAILNLDRLLAELIASGQLVSHTRPGMEIDITRYSAPLQAKH